MDFRSHTPRRETSNLQLLALKLLVINRYASLKTHLKICFIGEKPT